MLVLFYPHVLFSQFSLWAWYIFQVPYSIPISWLYILIVCIRVSGSFHSLFYSFGSFSRHINWWSPTEVGVTARPLRSLVILSIFWPITINLYSPWSTLVILFPSLPTSAPIPRWLYQEHQLQLLSLSLSCSLGFTVI